MPRNTKAVVPWDVIGAAVLDASAVALATHGPGGYQRIVARQFAAHGVTTGRLNNWLRSQPTWDARKSAALAAFSTNQPAPLTPTVVVPPPLDPLEEARERLERTRAINQEREALTALAGEQSLRGVMENLFREIVPKLPPPPKYHPPAKDSKASHESMVLQFSDWHAYEEVTAERTRDFNEYNAKIFGQRVYRVVQSAISIKSRMERGGGWHFRRLVVALNGDIVSGTIHEVERHTDAPNVVMAVYGAAMVLAAALRDLAAQWVVVDVYCEPGNHGRLPDARRVQQKDPTRSWDTMIALIAKTALTDCPNIHFVIPDSYSVAYDVEGWTFLQTHGHDIKSWNSLPFYGVDRMVRNLNALEASRNRAIHYVLLGHFHSKSALEHASGESFINGSLIGGTEFSLHGMGKSDRPSQLLLGVHKEQGVTHRWPLHARTGPDAPGYDVQPWRTAA